VKHSKEGNKMIGILLGAGAACLLWACGMTIWCIVADKRDDRRFNAMVRGMDAGRDKAWREMGVSEREIKQFYIKRKEIYMGRQ